MGVKVAVAGAGIYGSSIAIRLAELGAQVSLYDPLGVMRAASAINQYRVHRGYHYPRSPETIREVLESRGEFIAVFGDAICGGTEHYYAMPFEGSRISPDAFETVMQEFGLPHETVCPAWMNFDFIERCWRVEEEIYDPDRLRVLIERRLRAAGVDLIANRFTAEAHDDYDSVIYATYGASGSHAHLFPAVRFQVAEKILIELPSHLRRRAVVAVDGPFTAFDPFGDGCYSMFGSARHTNHWETDDPEFEIPELYRAVLNGVAFEPVPFTNFEKMRLDCAKLIPAAAEARYLGSRFTLRVVENDRTTDQRILHIARPAENLFHVFSGKVVSAVKAARIISEMVLGTGQAFAPARGFDLESRL